MATYTVNERGRDEKSGRPYTFSGTLEVVHTRDDGRRVVEFRTGGRPRTCGG